MVIACGGAKSWELRFDYTVISSSLMLIASIIQMTYAACFPPNIIIYVYIHSVSYRPKHRK